MRKTLVVFYSSTGTCRRLAQLLNTQFGWPLGEIREPHVRVGLRGVLRCVADSWLSREPPIRYEGPALRDFDAVVLLAPIWLYRLAGPMRSFIASHGAELRHYAVLSVMGGRGAPNAVAEIGALTGRAPLLSMAFTSREVDDGSCVARLPAFAAAVEGAATADTPLRPHELSPHTA
ncbi:flavodoxin [Rhodoferax koreense]|uniref:Flavodoxin n=1 Tax=Rhodoferax koreensis TaxID=1842727 RepID=A0A1P8JU36_9BURK|nr:flavodoxin [Rhodoferax koreense]APW37263.1 flavodoxin [Rhodoferax koreense]